MSVNSPIPENSTCETTVSPEVVQPYPKALPELNQNRQKYMKDSDDTSDLDSDTYSIKSSTMSVDGNTESGDDFINTKPAIDDWLPVKYTGKKIIKQFVGQILNISEDGLSINLLEELMFPNLNGHPIMTLL
ncbi:hypothetical protein AVEN_146092-1 [Araneus ventricosus]|uniref:Uncharacterized protein n=1 Tax=Araneus ventricosus TaxID=182803 RepID=A0A4Y2GN13_ARAVE|nr:hypothetical protein AVEN_146092-1 [Araneus ventricosus]